MHPTSQERLTLLPCGGRRTTNPELIASAALPRLLGELVQEYSVIIVDGPPLSAGIDAFAIGAACENTLMILRHSKTDMRMAKTKLALLRRLPLRTVGVVLNDVKAMGDYKYYGYNATYRACRRSAPSRPSSDGMLIDRRGDGGRRRPFLNGRMS